MNFTAPCRRDGPAQNSYSPHTRLAWDTNQGWSVVGESPAAKLSWRGASAIKQIWVGDVERSHDAG
jgi:hypothetical protein